MPDYIHLPFETACAEKWKHGVGVYRQSTEEPFNGEPLEEGYQEALDLYSYICEAARKYKTDMSMEKSMAKQLGLMLQAHHRRLTGQ